MDTIVMIYVEYDGFAIEFGDKRFRIDQEDNPGPILRDVFEELGISAEWEEVY